MAELYDPSSVDDVMVAQGHVLFEQGQHQRAEALFLRAQRPDVAVQSYKVVWEKRKLDWDGGSGVVVVLGLLARKRSCGTYRVVEKAG